MFGSATSASSSLCASVDSLVVEKKSIRRIEIPLNKFNEIAVPYHVDLLYKHKNNIDRYERLGQLQAAHREHVNAGRAVQQLKALIYEVDSLRVQVRDRDLEEFSKRTSRSIESVEQAIQAYLDMEKPTLDRVVAGSSEEWPGAGEDPSSLLLEAELPPLQLQADSTALEEAELARRETYLHSWEQLRTEFEDLHQLFQDFAAVVQAQGDLVSEAEIHTAAAQENVEEGNRILARASRLKAASYPVFGALLGGCMGGPIGLLAGLKLGGLAALGGGILGFTGGRFLKNKQITAAPEPESEEAPTCTTVSKESSCLNMIS